MEIVFFSDIPYHVGVTRYSGVYKLASDLRVEGYSSVVIESFCYIRDEDLFKIIDKYVTSETLALAFSSTFLVPMKNPHVNDMISISQREDGDIVRLINRIIDYSKQRNPEVKTIVGGANTNFFGMYQDVDYFIRGEAEESLPHLLKHLKKKIAVPGAVKRDKHQIIESAGSLQYHSFSKSKINWHESDFINSQEWLPIETARGCVFRCSFCNYKLNGKKPTDFMKSPEVLKEELIKNYELYGVTSYSITDDLFNDSVEKVEMFHRVFTDLPFNIQWVCYGRLDYFQRFPDMADLLLEAGLKSVYFGIETLNQKAGANVGKGLGKDRVNRLINLLDDKWGENVIKHGSFIVGLPREDESSITQTLNYLLSDESKFDSFHFIPLFVETNKDYFPDRPPSDFSANPEKYGLEIDFDKHTWSHELMNEEKSRKVAHRFNLLSSTKTKLSTFELAALCSLGKDFSEVSKLSRDYLSGDDYLKSKKKWIDDYVEKILSY